MQETVSRLRDVKDQIKELNAVVKVLEEEKYDLEATLIIKMQEAGFDQIRTEVGTVTLRETIVPTVTDWEAFYEHMRNNNALFMMERRASAAAFRDYLDMHDGQTPPGVEAFTKRAISLR